MPRRKLTEQEKEAMQVARVETRGKRAEALAVLAENDQFTNPKFWKLIDCEVRGEVVKAIQKAGQAEKQAKIARLEAELAELRGG